MGAFSDKNPAVQLEKAIEEIQKSSASAEDKTAGIETLKSLNAARQAEKEAAKQVPITKSMEFVLKAFKPFPPKDGGTPVPPKDQADGGKDDPDADDMAKKRAAEAKAAAEKAIAEKAAADQATAEKAADAAVEKAIADVLKAKKVTPSRMAAIESLAKASADLLKELKGETAAGDAPPVKKDEPAEVAKVVEAALAKALAPLKEELETIKKSRPASTAAGGDGTTTTQVTKSAFWNNITGLAR